MLLGMLSPARGDVASGGNVSSMVVRRVSVGLLVFALLGGWQAAKSGQRAQQSTTPSHADEWGERNSPASVAVLRRVPDALQADFALLRTPPDGLPASIRKILHTPTYGMNWKLARRLPIKAFVHIWVVPGNGFICLISQQTQASAGTICETTHEALNHGIATIFLSGGGVDITPLRRTIVGIAPDGTREVIANTQGSLARIYVTHGIFIHRDKSANPPDRLILASPGLKGDGKPQPTY